MASSQGGNIPAQRNGGHGGPLQEVPTAQNPAYRSASHFIQNDLFTMNPEASRVWRGPHWMLAALLACLSMLGPFSIDTYLPAFTGIAASLGATPVEMQQTLSAYLLGFAVMNLFHGALADSFGRRPVVLGGLALFTLASVGCALSQSIGMLVFFRAAGACRTVAALRTGPSPRAGACSWGWGYRGTRWAWAGRRSGH